MVKVMCVVKVKVTFDLQNSTVKVMAMVKPIGHIWGLGVQWICLLLVSWQSDHFWLRYSKFYIWSWKFKVKIMAKVKPDNHIWALELNRYVCFLFRGNRTIFGWDMANSIFDLEKSRSRSWPRSNPIVAFEPCFSFRGNRTIFGWDMANSIFDLEKSRSRSQRKWTKI